MAHNTTYFDDGVITRKQFDRFWQYVDVRGPDECWPWTRARLIAGYGVYRIGLLSLGNMRQESAHRIAFACEHHRWPNVCRHSCDNPPCCNPAHLLDGTHADNHADASERARWNPRKGAAHPETTLTETDIIAIRDRHAAGGITMTELARRYGVQSNAVWAIVHRVTWKHVNP